jgi:uncharacterized repeat protein (TIGR02543 family)
MTPKPNFKEFYNYLLTFSKVSKLISSILILLIFSIFNGFGQTASITITNASIGGSGVLGNNNYGSGAERTWSQNSVDFGGKAITCNPANTPASATACQYIQAQAGNAVIYNTTALPGRLVSVQFIGTQNVASSCFGGSSRLVNTTAANYNVTGGTQIGTAQTNTNYTWTTASTDNFLFFCIKRGTTAQYFSSIIITYETGFTVTFDANGGTGTMANQTASSATNLTANTFTRTGYTFAGWNTAADGSGTAYSDNASFPFTANTTLYAQWTLDSTPTLSANALTAFGSQCINNTYGPNSFTITGSSLTSANITVASLSGYTFSTTSSGTYTNSLSLSQSGGAYSQEIFVKFSPTAATAYNGNIVVGGGGASNIDVAASGTGISGAVGITTTVASTISASGASSGGTGISNTCGTITAKGVVWGTSANPTIASNLGITSNGTGTGNFTSSISGLNPNTTYNYRSYATNSNGITNYGVNLTFATLKLEPTNHPTTLACGTTTQTSIPLSWTDATGSSIPDGYLIKWSSVSFADISNPTDGSTANGANSTTINHGVQTANISGLTQNTTYYFKIWSYTNSAANIDYKTNTTILQTSCTTQDGPCLSEANFTALPTDWVATSVTYGSNEAVFGANNGELITLSLTNPTSLIFDLRRTTNANAKSLFVEISTTTQNGTFTTIETYDHSNTTNGGTTNCTIDLSAYSSEPVVFIKFRKASSTTSPWYIKNVEVFCNPAVPAPEINIIGNGANILNGSTTPDLANHTDFGNANVVAETVVRTFTIENTGTEILNLTGSSPYISITGTNAADFTLTSTPTTPIAASGNTTFQITFDPSALGTRTATITIANDDADEDPYTFDIKGTGTNSSTSDIIENTGFTYTSNINYLSFQTATITNTSQSLGVFQFTIRDGGASNDADALGTELNAITFNVANIENIRSAALFDGNALISNAFTKDNVAGTISFSGLSGSGVTAPDNGSKNVTLRITFLTTVTDNQQLQFTISFASASASGSSFASPNGGGANSSITGDRNRIEVVADRLNFVQQPSNVTINTAINPAVTVEAIDINNNRDLDYVSVVNITSSGSLSVSPNTANAVNGLATFSNIIHTTAQTLRVLTTNSGSLITANSNNFDISNVAIGAYRTKIGGTDSWATLSNWEEWNGTNWVNAAAIPNSTSSTVYILRDFNAVCNASKWEIGNLIIDNNATLTVFPANGGCSSPGINVHDLFLIKSGASVVANAGVTVYTGTILEIEDNASFSINYNASGSSLIWDGIENFHPNSNLIINSWNVGSTSLFTGTNITMNTYNGFTAAFGNIEINASSITNTLILMKTATNNNLNHGNITITNSNSQLVRVSDNSSVNTTIGGNIVMNASSVFEFSNVSPTITVKGDLLINSGTVRCQSNTGHTNIINIDGNIEMTGGTLNFNSNSGTSVVNVNLKGNFVANSSSTITNSDTDGSFLNFTGNSTQQVNLAVPINGGLGINIKSGADVELVDNNLQINGGSRLIVEDGGTLNFGFNGSTALVLTQPGSSSGTNTFNSQQGSTLKISSPDGITSTASIGNVQLSPSNRTYNQTAIFHYIGKSNQVTGNALTSGSTGKIVKVELENDGVNLTLSNSVGISNGTQIDASGGKLEVIRGVLIAPAGINFNGSGRLEMTGGEYRMATLNTTLPELSGAYTLSNGIINLNGTGNQALRGSRDYASLTFSQSGTKTTTSAISNISGTVTIQDNAILDVASSVFGGTVTNFTMTGGRFRTSRSASPLPDMNGNYNLQANTVVELYGTGTSQGLRGGKTYHDVEINNTSDAISAGVVQGAGNVSVNGTFTIKDGACYKMGGTAVIEGSGNFVTEANSTFIYGDANGIKTSGTSASDGNIRVAGTRNLSTDASYGFRGAVSPQNTGNGLPNTMRNLILLKDNSNNIITLNKNIAVTNEIRMETGRLNLNNNNINLGNTGSIINESDANHIYCLCPSGYIEKTVDLASSGTVNPGNIGLEFTMNGNAPGITTILRKHTVAENDPDGYPSSVHRSFDVSPTNNNGLGLDLKFYYLSSEIFGGSDANEYKFIKTTDNGLTWSFYANSVSNVGSKFVSIDSWDSFSEVTLSENDNPVNLPIKLLSFDAKYNPSEKQVDLVWKTSSEINNDYFTIYKSIDGINFKELKRVQGAGNSSQNLEYFSFDNELSDNKILYYQLKQTDFDGSFEYFNIVAIHLDETENEDILIETKNNQLNIFSLNGKISSVEIYSLDGKLIYNENTNSITKNLSLDFIESSSIYFIRLKSENQILNKKLFLHSWK